MQEFYPLRELFPGLEDELYDEMEQYGSIRMAPAGTVMLKKGQPVRATILILDGIVKFYQEDECGNEVFMYDLERGHACVISMVNVRQQECRPVVAKALTRLTFLTIPSQYMEAWLGRYKSWRSFVIRTWYLRYEYLLDATYGIAFKRLDERLEFYIKGRVQKMGRHIKLTHQQIATDLNSSREAISRLMKKMEKNGWVTIHRNSFEWKKT